MKNHIFVLCCIFFSITTTDTLSIFRTAKPVFQRVVGKKSTHKWKWMGLAAILGVVELIGQEIDKQEEKARISERNPFREAFSFHVDNKDFARMNRMCEVGFLSHRDLVQERTAVYWMKDPELEAWFNKRIK